MTLVGDLFPKGRPCSANQRPAVTFIRLGPDWQIEPPGLTSTSAACVNACAVTWIPDVVPSIIGLLTSEVGARHICGMLSRSYTLQAQWPLSESFAGVCS
jgi:hypothetical protein